MLYMLDTDLCKDNETSNLVDSYSPCTPSGTPPDESLLLSSPSGPGHSGGQGDSQVITSKLAELSLKVSTGHLLATLSTATLSTAVMRYHFATGPTDTNSSPPTATTTLPPHHHRRLIATSPQHYC